MAAVHSVSDRRSVPVTEFEVAVTEPGAAATPAELGERAFAPAAVPGTVASAARAAGTFRFETCPAYDRQDVWFRSVLPEVPGTGPRVLSFGGIATFADVWLGGEHVLASTNMFHAHEIDVPEGVTAGSPLVIRCRSLASELAVRRPRPRYKTRLVAEQQLRFVRTTLLGRIPAWSPPVQPVGPYRPIVLERREVLGRVVPRLVASLEGADGVVSGEIRVDGARAAITAATLHVGAHQAPLDVSAVDGGGATLSGAVRLPDVPLWWPHTHGGQPLFPVRVAVRTATGDVDIDLGKTGFRRLARASGAGFGIVVNGVPVFARGACWTPPDVVSLGAPPGAQRSALERARDAGMNMIRVGGTMIYEDDAFHALCDELGILVFQDFMLANMDYPAGDAAFVASLAREATEFLSRVQLSPSLAVLCGGSEVEQQAAMMGVQRGQWSNAIFEDVLPNLTTEFRPDVPYVPSTPTGGALPFHVDAGIAHYFGVGAYLRPLSDARRAGVRFAAECLAFANVPCDETIEAFLPDGAAPPHHPLWKARVPRDAGPGWDFDDVRDHYVKEIFGVDPSEVRYADTERYLALGRVATGEAMARTFAEFRRAAPACHGALIWFFRDLWPGAGWGVLDAFGRPKSAYYYLKRALAKVALFATDEGANGVEFFAVNDGEDAVEGLLELSLHREGAIVVAREATELRIPPRGTVAVRADALLPHFYDTAYAYRFGPPGIHAVAGVLRARGGEPPIAEALHFPVGFSRARRDLGLEATGQVTDGGVVEVTVRTRELAEAVSLDARGYIADENFFHLLPGVERRVVLRADGSHGTASAYGKPTPPARPSGYVTALNAVTATKIRLT